MKKLLFFILLFLSSLCSAQVVINEIQSSNATTLADSNGEYEDWIELYNPNDYVVDIGGLVLKDQVDVWQIPTDEATTALQPYSYFLLWCDDEESEGAFHTNFKISASNGEYIGLFESDSATEIESVNVPALNEDQSYGKCSGEWAVLSTPTPTEKNECGNSGMDNAVLDISEILTLSLDGELIIHLPESIPGEKRLSIHSMDGKVILNQEFYSSYYTQNLTFLNKNVYVVKIYCDEKMYSAALQIGK